MQAHPPTPAADAPSRATLVDLVESLPARGDRIAFWQRTGYRTLPWTYGRLHRAVLRFSTLLEQRGIAPGDRIMVWGPNSPAWVVVFLGSIYHGAVLVPIDLRHTPEVARDLCRETEARLLFRSRTRADPELGIPTVVLEELEEMIEPLPPAERPHPARPGDLVELVYTSGTTGRPKGVILTHGNIASNVAAMTRAVDIAADHTFLSVLPMSHLFEQAVGLLVPLSVGARIIYLPSLKPSAILSAFKVLPVTVMVAVPRFLQSLRDGILRQVKAKGRSALFNRLRREARRLPFGWRRTLFPPIRKTFGPSFNFFVSAGSPLDPELEDFWLDLGIMVLQGYGLTETSPCLTVNTPASHRPHSVGRPIEGVELRFDAQGTLHARGPNVTPGYYKNSEATAAAIRDGWYNTGDVGQLDPDGFLFLKGRAKDMIKGSSGVNVYPDDIETILKKIAGVRDACVLGMPSPKGEIVFAAILPSESRPVDAIVAEANQNLDTAQQIEQAVVWPHEDFPRTPTLKVKKPEVRRTLESLSSGGPVAAPAIVAGRLERVLAGVTSVRDFRPEAKLGWDLKLSSLDRVELASRLEEEFNRDVPEEQLTPETTVAAVRALVEGAAGEGARGHFRPWTSSPMCAAFRSLVQEGILRRAVRYWVSLRVEGAERLDALPTPALFVANHTSHLDAPTLMEALPARIRRRLAIAAWQEYFFPLPGMPAKRWFRKLAYNFTSVFYNVFPLPQTAGFRRSLEYAGSLIDRGWNVLLYPEGERSFTGHLLPVRRGIGILGAEMRVPVQPVYVAGLWKIHPRGSYRPKPGVCVVRFGEPLRFSPRDSTVAVAQAVGAALARLQGEVERDHPEMATGPVPIRRMEDAFLTDVPVGTQANVGG